MNHVEHTIDELTRQIADRQDAINALHKLLGHDQPPPPLRNTECQMIERTPRKAKATKPAGKPKQPEQNGEVAKATLPTSSDYDKPLTLGRVMKRFIFKATKFTGGELRDQITANPIAKQLLDDCSAGALPQNLSYWASKGHLASDGKSTMEATFTVQDREFFAE